MNGNSFVIIVTPSKLQCEAKFKTPYEIKEAFMNLHQSLLLARDHEYHQQQLHSTSAALDH